MCVCARTCLRASLTVCVHALCLFNSLLSSLFKEMFPFSVPEIKHYLSGQIPDWGPSVA